MLSSSVSSSTLFRSPEPADTETANSSPQRIQRRRCAVLRVVRQHPRHRQRNPESLWRRELPRRLFAHRPVSPPLFSHICHFACTLSRPIHFPIPSPSSYQSCHLTPSSGITISIYGSSGNPDNNGKAYVAPGPAVLSCGSGGGNTQIVPTTTKVVPTTTKAAITTTTKAATTLVPVTTPPSTGGAPLYGQCGGNGWTGPTTCASGTCTAGNEWYSQCLP